MSTGARLLASLLFLVLFGGGALVAFRNDLLTSWFQDGEKRNTNDEEAERQKEAERLAAAQKEKERKAEEARQQERDRNQPTVAFEAYRDSNQFQKALDVLKQTPAAFVPADEDDLRARWQNLAGQRFLNGNYRDAAKQYEELAAEFGDDARIADWKLMIARARIALRQDARNLIEPLTPPQKRDTGRDRIFYLVKLIVDTKAGKDLDRVDQLYQVWNEHSKKNSQPTPATDEERLWTATDAERAELNSARGAVINHWFENTDKRRDEKSLATLDQLVEMEPDNVDLWIAKADLHLDLEEPEEAAEALRRRAVLKDAPEWMADRAFFLDTYYALKDPKADEERITAALQNVQTLMAQFAERRVTLAKALRELADRDPKHLTQVVQSLRRDAEEADADRELKTAFAELLKQDIQKRLSGETRFRDIARDLLKDCTFVAANSDSPASVPEFVRACHAECLLELRQGDPQQVLGSAGTTPYYHYVRARVFSRAGNAQEVNASLKQLFANPAPSLKSWTERLQTSVGLVDDIADQVRGAPMEFKVEQLLTQPVDESAPARETLTLLRNAYQWVQPSLLSAESRANLAIASWWMKGNEDQELARKLSEEIVRDWLGDKSGETSQPRLAFSLYHAFLAAHQDTKEPAIEDLRIEAARRLIQVCSSRSLDDRDAAQFYQRIVEPLEALAQTQRKHEFFAEAAGLIALYPRFDWKFSAAGNATLTMAEKLDQLYTRAIEASEKKIAAYFKGRADARLMRQPLDYAAIRGDANVLKDSEDFQAHGYAVEGHILYHQARYSAAGLEDRLKSLNLARSALLQAEKLARQAGLLHKDELGRVLYFLSLVHLERGNFGGVVPTGDRTEIIAKKEFEQARDYAEAVIAMGGGPSLQYAYEAAANAYEDLAWHAGESAEANFYKAVDHLRNSVAFHRDSPLAHAALARCYYKMVAEKHVNPPQLRSTYAGHLEAARQALKDAIALPGGDKDPETHLWLGKVIQATYVDEKTLLEQATAKLTEQDYRAADEEFSKALEAAKKARLSPAYLATYAVASAEHAFLNPVLKRDFNSADPKAKTTALNTIHVRCDQLAALEGAKTLRMDPPQEARILRAKADLFTKTPMAVLDSLEQRVIELSKLPESDLTRSDVKLVEFRLGLHAQLQPHQTTKELVESAILDALWYSKAPIALVAQDKVRVLLNAMRLSQQRALKDSVVTAVDQQVKCVQRIIDLKLGSQFDINRHREVITACANGLAQANTEATKAANQKLRQVTRAYIQQALKSADERNRPAAEIKVLNDFLAAIPQ